MRRRHAAQIPKSDERARVVVGERLALQLGDEPLVVPHVEEIVLAENVDLAGHPADSRSREWMSDASLRVELGHLSEVVHPVEKLQPRGMSGRHLRQPILDAPSRPASGRCGRIRRSGWSRTVAPVLLFDERAEPVGELQPPLVVNSCRQSCPQERPLAPLCSTKIHPDSRGRAGGSQPQKSEAQELRLIFAVAKKVAKLGGRAAAACYDAQFRSNGRCWWASAWDGPDRTHAPSRPDWFSVVRQTTLFQLLTSAREAPRSGRQDRRERRRLAACPTIVSID